MAFLSIFIRTYHAVSWIRIPFNLFILSFFFCFHGCSAIWIVPLEIDSTIKIWLSFQFCSFRTFSAKADRSNSLLLLPCCAISFVQWTTCKLPWSQKADSISWFISTRFIFIAQIFSSFFELSRYRRSIGSWPRLLSLACCLSPTENGETIKQYLYSLSNRLSNDVKFTTSIGTAHHCVAL
jgi:hypothetical protein